MEGSSPSRGGWSCPEGSEAVREWLGEVGRGRKAARGGGSAEATVQGALRTLGRVEGRKRAGERSEGRAEVRAL